MRSMLAGLFCTVLGFCLGCNTHSTPGGPGATRSDTRTVGVGQAEDTFRLDVPNLATRIKQSESKIVTIGIKRGKNFDQDVELKLSDLPQGVTLDPANPTIKHSEKEVPVTVKAADDAAVGDFTIKVAGHPTKGPDATSEFKLTVDKK